MPPTVAKADPLSGRVGHLTETQQRALETLRQELKDESQYNPERHDDALLLRFLRARKFDVAKAKFMLIEQEKWRVQFGVEEINKEFVFPEKEAVDKLYPQFYHKTDKDGRPVYIERLANIDIKALYAITTEDRLLKRLVYEYERCNHDRMPACSIEKGQPIETSCTILDLKGVGISKFYNVKDYVSKASSIGQDRYPESMGKFYIINAPWGFSTVWNLIKGWLDEVTVEKIHILGSDYKAELIKQIPSENLPSDLGGTCKCAVGCSLSDEGPWKDPAIMKQVQEVSEERRKAVSTTPTTTATAPAPTPIHAVTEVNSDAHPDAALQT